MMHYVGVSNADINVRGKTLLAKSIREMNRKELNPSKREIAFNNGLLDLDTDTIVEHHKDNHVLSALSYDYNPNAKCPQWNKFLNHVLPEPESRAVLQEYLGAIFIDRKKTSLEQMLILLGGGSNGKSVVFNTIKGILGEANISFTPIADLVSSKSAESTATVDGKLLNYNSELGKSEFSGHKIKALISGEERPARQLWKDPFVARNIPLMMANANELPDTKDDSAGYFRRFKILIFGVKIEDKDQDKNLANKLKSEYSGIFNWIIEGRKRFVANNYKFTESASSIEASKNYESSSNSALLFLKEKQYFSSARYNGQIPSIMKLNDIYREYCDYCRINNYKEFSARSFSDKLFQRDYLKTRASSGYQFRVFKAPYEDEIERLISSGVVSMGLSEFRKHCGYDFMECVASERKVEKETELEIDFNDCP